MRRKDKVENTNSEKTEKKKKKIVSTILWGFGNFIFSLLGFSIEWGMKTWSNLSMEEMVFTLTTSIKGTGNGMIKDYVFASVLPALGVTFVAVFIYIFLRFFLKQNYPFRSISLIISMSFFALLAHKFWVKLDISSYLNNQNSTAEFIEAKYVNPQDVTLTFPAKKRNLIYIYLESMETTFADTENGGGFDFNCIPELTKLSQDNENFSGNSTELNGGYVFTGSTWTMGALFTQTCGIPLQISIDGNSMNTQEHFFPGIINLGDILQANGYNQTFMIGSDAEFGGRNIFFSDHGQYQIKDYYYAIDNSLIPEEYQVFWGYEDKKLFDFAKEEILKVADQQQPFNFTILTVDTHFEDGYLCEDCGSDFGSNQYANVYACSSKKVAEFVNWIQQQDFYQNTTIVLSGDHLTMDSDFCNNISQDCERKNYVCFINPGCENLQPEAHRSYCTLDMFPTTLASLGVEIEHNRLGLGTNLFSKRQTLVEEFGKDYVGREVAKQSSMLAEMAELDKTSDTYLKSVNAYPKAHIEVESLDDGTIKISVSNIENVDNITSVELEFEGNQEVKTIEFEESSDIFHAILNVSDYSDTTVTSTIYIVDGERKYNIGELSSDLSLYTNNFGEYLSYLKQKDYAVFFAICDEGTTALNSYARSKLKSLGLEIDLAGRTRSAYYALIENKSLICEEVSDEKIGSKGTLADGSGYLITSSGFNTGSYCSIRIEGEEYAIGSRGLNIVVYDNETHKVMDSVCFDTYSGKKVTRNTGTIETDFLENKSEANFIPDENLQIEDFCTYLRTVKENSNYVMLLAIRDEGTAGLTSSMQAQLKACGLQTDLSDKYRMSYYAVVDGDRVIEEVNEAAIETSGTFSNGSEYEIFSEGYNQNGSYCSIIVNGSEFAVNSRGMNIVIYDKERDCVVDSVAFDTHDKGTAKRK